MSKSSTDRSYKFTETRKYLREISVVVIGVAITLSVSYWLGVKSEKRDMALHLNAIKMELEENAKDIGYLIELLNPELKYTTYLQSHDKKFLDKDTLNSYFLYCYDVARMITFKTNAFEMFKNSGTMRLMDDRELLLAIWTIYDELALLKQLNDEQNKLKCTFMEKEISLVDIDINGKFEMEIIPMYDYYKKVGGATTLMNINMSERCLKNIKELILRLEELEMIKQFKTSEINSYNVSDEDLDKYLGIYYNKDEPFKITISKANKQLYFQATGQPSFSLKAISEDKFEFEMTGVIFEFNPTEKTIAFEENGKIYKLVKEE